MKNFEDKIVKVISQLTCDGCGEKATPDDSEFHEFISINHRCGFGSIHGDGNQISIDLCQKCFASMCGDSLSVIEPNDEKYDDEDKLEYHNIFDAITQSKKEALNMKHDSDLRIAARNILSANKITNKDELSIALKRVGQLWNAQYHSAEGNELHQLADLICAYEGKSWESYFNSVDVASDDFMVDRNDIIEVKRVDSGSLSGMKVNNGVGDNESLKDSVNDDIDVSINQVLPTQKIEILETLTRVWTKYPDLRLTQLIVNAIPVKSPCPEIFYIQDSEIINKLKQLLQNST